MQITEFMTPAPYTIGVDQTLSRAHEMMQAHGIRHLPVLRGASLVGVLSLGDLHALQAIGGPSLGLARVDRAMTPDPYVVGPESDVREVAKEMVRHKFGTALVVEDGRVLGIFTTIDALRALIAQPS